MKTTYLAPLGAAVLLAAPAFCGDLDKKLVPADAGLVVHLDVAALQRTQLWKLALQNEHLDLESALADLAEVEAELGIDPLRDILSVTAFSHGPGTEPSAAVILATSRVDRALERMKEEEEYRFLKVDGVELHAMEDFFLHVHPTAGGDRLLVVADSEAGAARATRVVHGDARSLADAPESHLSGSPAPGSFLFAATVGDLGDHAGGFQPASQVFGLAQGIQFDLGEAGGSFFVRAALRAESVERAREMTDIVEGVLAMGRMMLSVEGDVPAEAIELLRGIRVTGSGDQVGLEFEYATAALFELLEELEELDGD